MTDDIKSNLSAGDKRHHEGNSDHCGVTEESFPCLGECCREIRTLAGVNYESSCPYCNVWASLPDGASLSIAVIFGCSLYGYDKRIKQ